MEKTIKMFVNKHDRSLWYSKDYYEEIRNGTLILFPYNDVMQLETRVPLEYLDKWIELELYIRQLRTTNKLLSNLVWVKQDCETI